MYSLTAVCIFWCSFKLCRCEKLFPHKLHECGFSLVWTLRCVLRDEALKNVFPHWSHVYSFSLVWMFVCFLRVDNCEKLFPHWSQVNGFSPVWTLIWSVRFPFIVKLFPHWSHVYGFSPVWILSCIFRSPEWLNLLSQCEHLNGFSPVWTLMWSSRLCLHVKLFPHWVQVKDFLVLVFLKIICLLWQQLKCFSPVLKWFFPSNSLNSLLSSFSLIDSEIKAKTVPLSVTHKKVKRHKTEPWCNSGK